MTPLQLHERARAGDVKAQVAISAMFDREGRHDVALAWLEQAAAGGSLEAETALGSRLLVGRAAPFDPAQGAARLYRAADRNTAEACLRAAVLILRGIGRSPDANAAFDYLLTAALKGAQQAQLQLAVLADDHDLADRISRGAAVSGNRMKVARRKIDFEAWVAPVPAEVVSERPHIRVFPRFADTAVQDWVKQRAARSLDDLRVYDAKAGGVRAHEMRTSRGTGFGLLDTDVILTLLALRMEASCSLPLATFEPPNVLNYAVGQEYRPHYDFLDPEAPALAEALARQGQRIATFLLYLNDDYQGGETAFPRLEWSFKASAGDALLFYNVDAQHKPVTESLHAGLPPTHGEKWLLSQWIRDRPQPMI